MLKYKRMPPQMLAYCYLQHMSNEIQEFSLLWKRNPIPKILSVINGNCCKHEKGALQFHY